MLSMTNRSAESLHSKLDLLLEPISRERPCGEWLRYEGTYDQIREARREDDASLPQGVWQSELKRADWESVESVCIEALGRQSKDLQIAAWLLEAWIHLDGIAGVACGIELMRRMCVAYWDGMYPALDGEMTARLAPVQWINEKLSRKLRLLKLTQPSVDDVASFSLADWDAAVQRDAEHDRASGGSQGATNELTLSRFEQSVSLTQAAWFDALLQAVRKASEEARLLDGMLDEKTGNLNPGLLKFRHVLETMEQLLAQICTNSQPEESAFDPESQNPVHDSGVTLAAVADARPVREEQEVEALKVSADELSFRTREDAYHVLSMIASYLQRIEPHSPTPYLIRRAVAWGGMEFGELMQELIRDRSEYGELMRLLHLDVADAEKLFDGKKLP